MSALKTSTPSRQRNAVRGNGGHLTNNQRYLANLNGARYDVS